MGEIADTLGDIAESIGETVGPALRITTTVIALTSILSSIFGENADAQPGELPYDIQQAQHEKEQALDSIEKCRKSIQTNRETILKYRYQEVCPNAIREIDDGVADFEKLLDVKLYDEALCSAQKVAETARNYAEAVLESEKVWTNGKNLWTAVREMVNKKIQQLNSDGSKISLPSGEKIPFLLKDWADEDQIEGIKQAVIAQEPPKGWTMGQIQEFCQSVIDRLNQLTTEAADYCRQSYLRGQASRKLIVTLKNRSWRYKGFQYEKDDPKQELILKFESVTGDQLKAAFNLNQELKLNVTVKSNNTDSKRDTANRLAAALQEYGIEVHQLDWD